MSEDWQAENDADTIMRAEQIERDKARAAKAKQVLQGRKAAIEEALGEKPEDHLARGYRKPGKK
jgi:hypothetical protein